jgi:arylsulfatase
MKGMGVDIFIATPGKSYTMTADVDVQAGANGVIVAQGGRFGGFSFFVKDGKPTFVYNYLGRETFTVASAQALTPGRHTVVYAFKSDGGLGKGGVGTITVDGNKAGEGRIEKTQPGIFSVDDLADVGTDDGTPVTDYGKSRKFNGTLNKVTIETSK